MKAVVFTENLPIEAPGSLIDIELEPPDLRPHDLRVAVHAVSVNPVDVKVRAGGDVAPPGRVLGWDAAGEVVEVGPDAEGFHVGDAVYFAGDLTRPGSNAALCAVDSRITAHKPSALDFGAAAALPLTALTAWEAMFERMGIAPDGSDAGRRLLVVGGAGGVGSIAIQLAKRMAGLTVIATASRPESRAWVERLGADAVINHHQPLDEGLRDVTSDGQVEFILCLNRTDHHWPAMCAAIAPQGTIGSIVETEGPLDLSPLKAKSARFAWEFMFTRSMFETSDLARQGEILRRVAGLVNDGTLVTTATTELSPLDAETLREAHRRIESGRTIGKIVVRR